MIQGWIAAGAVAVNGVAAARPAARLRRGDEIVVLLPPAPPRRLHLAQELPLAILYEDEHLLAVDKAAGLVAHPTAGHRDGTLWNALLFRAQAWSAAARSPADAPAPRPSLVHRLDRGTSGVLLVAKSAAVHAGLQRALRAAAAEKVYLAVVHGRTRREHGRMTWRIGVDPEDRRRRLAGAPGDPAAGREALTLYERLAESAAAPLSLLACRLKTGRTHQIRVHLRALGHPLVGDAVYGLRECAAARLDRLDGAVSETCAALGRPALHAWRCRFVHPVSRERLEIAAPLPPDLAALLAAAGLALPAWPASPG